MIACPQTPKQNVLEHGRAVAAVYDQLYDWIRNPTEWVQTSINCGYDREVEPPYQLPDWVTTYQEEILDALDEYDWELINQYQVHHDCGKPFCRTIDEQGRQHFPDHANISAQVYRTVYDDGPAATWVQHDMDAHVLKAQDVPEFCNIEGCIILLVTALAEIHANASMFGGTASTSFKIKFKHLDRRGRAICKHLWGTRG